MLELIFCVYDHTKTIISPDMRWENFARSVTDDEFENANSIWFLRLEAELNRAVTRRMLQDSLTWQSHNQVHNLQSENNLDIYSEPKIQFQIVSKIITTSRMIVGLKVFRFCMCAKLRVSQKWSTNSLQPVHPPSHQPPEKASRLS